MPSRVFTLYQPFLGLISGSGDAVLTLSDADDRLFEIPDQTGNNQTALLDGSPVQINGIEQAIGPQLIVATVGGLSVNLSLTPVRIVVETGLFDTSYILFPDLPDGAVITLGLSVPLLFPSDVAVPLCLAAQTLIRVPDGLRPIGDIVAGDDVLTVDGGAQTVRWVGRQHVDFASHPDMQRHRPILIRKNAFGAGRPFRDLVLSPQHAVLFDGWDVSYFTGEDEVLAVAKSLVNGKTIVPLGQCASVDYCHLLFDDHHVIWAQGLRVESLFLGDLATDTLLSHKREELLAVFPDLAREEARLHHRARARVKSFEVAAMLAQAA